MRGSVNTEGWRSTKREGSERWRKRTGGIHFQRGAPHRGRKLTSGPATIQHGSTESHVSVTVLEFETLHGEQDEPACPIEIGYGGKLERKLLPVPSFALDHLSADQL